MLKIWETTNNKLEQISEIKKDTWINLVGPSEDELKRVYEKTDIHFNLLKKVLDPHESARVEVRSGATLIVLSIPTKIENGFRTIPLGIIISDNYVVTLINDNQTGSLLFKRFIKNKKVDTKEKTKFVFNLFLEISAYYQIILNELQKILDSKEKHLLKATDDEEMHDLLSIQKSLVYFIKSLNMNEVVFEKLMQGNILKMNNEEEILFEDVTIENKQAINMATLYQELLKSVMDTYETIISNNLNKVMKFLTGITIVFTIPTTVASFMGMNVKLGYFNDANASFPILVIISLILSLIVLYIFKRKNWL